MSVCLANPRAERSQPSPARLTSYAGGMTLVGIAAALVPAVAPWQGMSLLALALFVAFKWITFRQTRRQVGRSDAIAYFCAWPGLDADEFFARAAPGDRPDVREWGLALSKTVLGAIVVWAIVPALPAGHEWLAGALGFAGLVLLLHFGVFHLLAVAWRAAGWNVRPIMNRPFAATSLTDFWGNRWNRAYRSVSHDLFFRPFVARKGPGAAMFIAFFASGLIHDLVISLPAGEGYGRPTAYFLLQAVGILFERNRTVRRAAAKYPKLSRCYAAAFLILPLGWLFPEAFLTRVIGPFLSAISWSSTFRL